MGSVAVFLFIFLLSAFASQNLPSEEFNALYDLYSATHGTSWIYDPSNTSFPWNFSSPDANPCVDSWQGVSCVCIVECNVQSLELKFHNLTGTLPDSIGDFPELTLLDLSYNYIRSQFPESVRDLRKLQSMLMRQNQFTGSLPSLLGSLTELTLIDFSGNFLQFIPESFYNNVSILETLDLSGNFLEGSISSKIDQLKKLKLLALEINFLNGSIPVSIGNLQDLTVISVPLNDLTGTFPNSFLNLTNLKEIDIAFNFFESTIPAGIGNLTKMTDFIVNSNNLFGRFPPSLGNTALRYFDCDNNTFSGPIPSSFSNLKDLLWIYLAGNSFTGEISIISAFEHILGVVLVRNFFHGEVSPQVFEGSNDSKPHVAFFEFSVAQNLLSGPLPLTNLSHIIEYQFNENYFAGTIPNNYSVFFEGIDYFSISGNYISGTIPPSLFSGERLTTVNASHNFFTGPLPAENEFNGDTIGGNIVQLSFENNFLTGTVPPSFGNLSELVTFSFSNNDLTGTVPLTFRKLNNLRTLHLNNNNFQGSMNLLLSNGLPNNMTTIDLSNNQFTGSLPRVFFANKSANLETFIALSNCLTGSLPESICQATQLVDLILDGLSTAENCRRQLFENIPYLNSFTLKDSLDGTIPPCLLSMTHLHTLHLSGNGLTGSLPSNGLNLSVSLLDLTLSHNALTGSIPDAFQNRVWYNLDLSYNKITGTLSLSSFSELNSQTSSLSLEVNRLSGNIPSALFNLESVSVLNGNIFECNLQGSNLPSHDPEYESYSCGSNSVNDLLYVWLSLFGLLVILIALFYLYRKHLFSDDGMSRGKWFSSFMKLTAFALTLKSYYQKMEEFSQFNPDSNVSKLHNYFNSFRKTLIFVTMILLIIFLPIYIVLTTFYQNYKIEYVWNVSAVLLSSSTAGIVLLLMFTLFISLIYFVLLRNIQGTKMFEGKTITNSVITRETEQFSASAASASSSSSFFLDAFHIETVFSYFIVFISDLIIMIFADILYILVVINYGAVEITLAAIALAIFRIISNNVLAWKSIPLSRYYSAKLISCCQTKQSPEASTTDASLRHRDVAFLEIMTLFNILLIPILVVLIILPDCFYNAFVQSSDVTSSFSFRLCEQYFDFEIGSTEVNRGVFCLDQTETTSYTPPFIYLYQCSSKIIIYYVPVYLILFLFAGVIIPVKNLIILYRTAMKPKSEDTSEAKMVSDSTPFLHLLNPTALQPLVAVKPDKFNSNLFPRIQVTIQLTSYLAIIIAFGTLFPPLAAIGCWTIVVITLQEELFIGRILKENDETYHYEWYLPQLEGDCRGMSSSLKLSFPWILIFSCWLFGYILFDTWGDESGWEEALPATFIMMTIPLLLIGGWNLVYYCGRAIKVKDVREPRSTTVTQGNREIQMSRTSSISRTVPPQFVVNPIVVEESGNH
jgi:Leucine-rich repeat (LRR) protein